MILFTGGHAWLLGGCVVAGGMHGCWGVHGSQGGMRGCQGVYVVARGMHGCWEEGACMIARGGMNGCHGGVHGCQGACTVSGEVCMVSRGCAWRKDMTRYRNTINERAVHIPLECILVTL